MRSPACAARKRRARVIGFAGTRIFRTSNHLREELVQDGRARSCGARRRRAKCPANRASALSPYLVVPAPSVAESSAAYRYANMSDSEVYAELDKRKVPYKKADPIAGVGECRSAESDGEAGHGRRCP